VDILVFVEEFVVFAIGIVLTSKTSNHFAQEHSPGGINSFRLCKASVNTQLWQLNLKMNCNSHMLSTPRENIEVKYPSCLRIQLKETLCFWVSNAILYIIIQLPQSFQIILLSYLLHPDQQIHMC